MIGDIKLAVVGLGYWGPNLLRCAVESEAIDVKVVCDRDNAALAKLVRRYPHIGGTHSFESVLADPEIEAVILATPVRRTTTWLARLWRPAKHRPRREAAGRKHSEECLELIRLAERQRVVLMPGHTFLYSPPVNKVKDLIEEGSLGDLYFGTSSRVNLGIDQSDISVVRDLAPHDFSILLYWLGRPTFVREIGAPRSSPARWTSSSSTSATRTDRSSTWSCRGSRRHSSAARCSWARSA